MKPSTPVVRVGIPLTGGALVAAARERRYPVLFSANAFARVYGKGHQWEGDFRKFALPDPSQFEGLDAALDSAGFVAAVKYGDYRWTVSQYYDLVQAYPWAWHAALDYCCEPELASDRPTRLLRIAATARMLGECRREAAERGIAAPLPVVQGFRPDEYVMCAQWLPLLEWRDLIDIGSVCRRPVHGPIARTTASPSSVSPSAVTTPDAAPSRRATSSTTAMRSFVPRACAASSKAEVNRAGVTCAVVSVEPSVAVTTPEPSSQRGADARWPPANASFSRAAIMNVSMRR